MLKYINTWLKWLQSKGKMDPFKKVGYFFFSYPGFV